MTMNNTPDLDDQIDEVVVGLIRTFTPDELLIPLKEGESYHAYDRDSARAKLQKLIVEARIDEWDFIAESFDDAQEKMRNFWLENMHDRIKSLKGSLEEDN